MDADNFYSENVIRNAFIQQKLPLKLSQALHNSKIRTYIYMYMRKHDVCVGAHKDRKSVDLWHRPSVRKKKSRMLSYWNHLNCKKATVTIVAI